ncbi:MAG: PTS sugar transporter subunit IIA [Elusimicrobiota bacterium]|jgi:PTS system nitrogen regulatory IIA component|nr:PTS sugar transporter subunit IIA [Elusimicrobiota bacterium]
METIKNRLAVTLNKNRVFIIKDEITKKDLVAKLVNAICDDTPEIDREDALNAVLKREEGISTTLDTGLSIPHARWEDLNTFQAAVAVIPNSISDEYGLKIKVMYLFLSPAGPLFFPQHLKLLASLAERFKTPFIEELVAAKDEQEVLDKVSF